MTGETIYPLIALAIFFLGGMAINRCLERDHKRRMADMETRHEAMMAELRMLCAELGEDASDAS